MERSHSNVKYVNVASVIDEKKPLKYESCDYSCFERASLKNHITLFHEGKKPLTCEVYDYSSTFKIKMNRHAASS